MHIKRLAGCALALTLCACASKPPTVAVTPRLAPAPAWAMDPRPTAQEIQQKLERYVLTLERMH